jgi:chromosome segregation ATPase
MPSIITEAEAQVTATRAEIARLEQELHAAKARRRELVAAPPAESVEAVAQRDAERTAVEHTLGRLDGDLRLAQARLQEHEHELQRAHSRVQNQRNRLYQHGQRLIEDERLAARARQALEQAEARVQAITQDAAEAHQQLAALLGVDEASVDLALAEIDQEAMGELVRAIEPAVQVIKPAYPSPVRSLYGTSSGDQHFDAQGRPVDAWGNPITNPTGA